MSSSTIFDTGRRPAARASVVAYDFRRPTKVSRDQLRTLQLAFDTAARQLTTLLTSGLRQVCHVQANEVSQRSYDDHIAGLDAPSVTMELGLAPLPGTGTLHFSVPVALAAVDHMLGGPGGKQPARTLTDIEVSLLHSLLDQIVVVLRYALEPVVSMELSLGPIEYNPQFLQANGAADAVLVGEFVLRIGDEVSPLLISLPLAPLLPSLNALHARDVKPAGIDLDAPVSGRMADLPIDVSVSFDAVTLSPEQILALEVGDVLALPHRVGVPLTLHAGGVAYAQAVSGRTGSQLAALVTGTPAHTAQPAPLPRSFQ